MQVCVGWHRALYETKALYEGWRDWDSWGNQENHCLIGTDAEHRDKYNLAWPENEGK